MTLNLESEVLQVLSALTQRLAIQLFCEELHSLLPAYQ